MVISAANGRVRTASAVGNPYTFTGRRLDNETGLYYYRARYYSPRLGRFLQTDPIGYADGINWYAYCGNNPIGWIDPYGLCQQELRSDREADRAAFPNGVWSPVPGHKGWEVRPDKYGHGDDDPPHSHFKKRGKRYNRRVYEDGSQKPHGQNKDHVDKDVPQEVIDDVLEEMITTIGWGEVVRRGAEAVGRGIAETGRDVAAAGRTAAEWTYENPGAAAAVVGIIVFDLATGPSGEGLLSLEIIRRTSGN